MNPSFTHIEFQGLLWNICLTDTQRRDIIRYLDAHGLLDGLDGCVGLRLYPDGTVETEHVRRRTVQDDGEEVQVPVIENGTVLLDVRPVTSEPQFPTINWAQAAARADAWAREQLPGSPWPEHGYPNGPDGPARIDHPRGPEQSDLRARIAAELAAEHHRRAQAQIAASPEEHSAALAEAVMPIVMEARSIQGARAAALEAYALELNMRVTARDERIAELEAETARLQADLGALHRDAAPAKTMADLEAWLTDRKEAERVDTRERRLDTQVVTPALFVDREGDIWRKVAPDRYRLVRLNGVDVSAEPRPHLTRANAEKAGGPLSRLEAPAAPGPCPVCGLATDAQKHGDGRCNHTPT